MKLSTSLGNYDSQDHPIDQLTDGTRFSAISYPYLQCLHVIDDRSPQNSSKCAICQPLPYSAVSAAPLREEGAGPGR